MNLQTSRTHASAVTRRSHRWVGVVVLIPVAIWLAYFPGLSGPFVFDDFNNIVKIAAIALDRITIPGLLDAAYSAGMGYPERGLARVSFALNYVVAGRNFDPYAFKLVNLLVHMANALLLYLLSARLLARRVSFGDPRAIVWPALAVALLWALHPLQLTSVLYVVQRMNSLAGSFALLGLLLYVVGRERYAAGRRGGLGWMCAGVLGGTLLGFLCKENSVLLPVFALLVEWFFYPGRTGGDAPRRGLWVFYGLALGIPLLAVLGYAVYQPDFLLGGYESREFTLVERLLTESRVLVFYLSLLFYPALHRFGLYHDDIPLSTGLFEPWTTAVAALGWPLVVAAALWWGWRRRSLWAFGVLWFVVGHSMESTVLSLELVHEHRNYLPSIGPLLCAVIYAREILDRVIVNGRLRAALVVLGLAVLGFSTHVRATLWANRASLMENSVRNHPMSSRTQGSYAAYLGYIRGDHRAAFGHWQLAAGLNPGEVLGLVEMARIIAPRLRPEPRAEARRVEPVPDVLNAALPDDPRRLRDYARAISGEILRRLRTRVLNQSTVGSLQDLSQCVARGALDCVPIAVMAYAWVQTALANSRVAGHARPVLYVSGAVIAGVLGQRGCAIEWLNAAIAEAPHDVDYRLRLVRELQLTGQWSAARAALHGARANDRSGASRDRIDAFAADIGARQSAASKVTLTACHALQRSATAIVDIERR